MYTKNQFINNIQQFFFFALTVLTVLTLANISTNAQKLAANINLDQCANGTKTNPEACTGTNWVNGNLGASKSHYVEGQSVPYRATVFDTTSITIEYDTTKSGKHAIDYLTSFDRNETTANPCSGVATCDLASYIDVPIIVDPNVSNAGITQIPGNIRVYNVTSASVSTPTLVSGTYAGDSSTALTVTFTPISYPVVLTWGGHISTRADWGINNSSINISGSPYHMRNGGAGGNTDLSLTADAVDYPAQITIIKEVTTATGGTTSTESFPFTTINLGTPGFSLVDSNNSANDRLVVSNIINFGEINSVTVTESLVAGWSLTDLACVETSGGLPNIANSTTNLLTRTANLTVEEGEFITCTFKSLQIVPTASNASISGRTTTSSGRPIRNVLIALTGGTLNEVKYARSNFFGYYHFQELPTGQTYILTATSKRYVFTCPTRVINFDGDLTGEDFVSESN